MAADERPPSQASGMVWASSRLHCSSHTLDSARSRWEAILTATSRSAAEWHRNTSITRLLWRMHSCVQRSHSCERVFGGWLPPPIPVIVVVAVVTRCNPVCAPIRRASPVACTPFVARSHGIVITVDPRITGSRVNRTDRRMVTNHGQWRRVRAVTVIRPGSDANSEIETRRGKHRASGQQQNCEQLGFHVYSPPSQLIAN